MSYDLMIFDPSAPPGDRAGFLAWYTSVARIGDGSLVSNPAIATPALKDWYREMLARFPAIDGPDGPEEGDSAIMENKNRTEYRFAPTAVFAAFEWEVSRQAYRYALKAAREHNLGFFDVSGEAAAVWSPDKGAYKIVHCGEPLSEDPDAPEPLRKAHAAKREAERRKRKSEARRRAREMEAQD